MKRLTDKQQAARIAVIMDRWLRRLDLYNTWAVSVEMVCQSDLPTKDTLASVDFNLPYRRATILVSRFGWGSSRRTGTESRPSRRSRASSASGWDRL